MRLNDKKTVILLCLSIALVFYAYHLTHDKRDLGIPQSDQVPKVQVIEVKSISMHRIYKTVGSINAKRDINIVAAVNGRVTNIKANPGETVLPEQTLIELAPSTAIRSPIKGILNKWEVKPGEYVTTDKLLNRVVDNSDFTLEYYIPEKYRQFLKVGQQVIFEPISYPGVKFIGELTFIASYINVANHSIQVEVRVTNVDDKLISGMYGSITHYMQKFEQPKVISDSCLLPAINGYKVFVVENGIARSQQVVLHEIQNGRAIINSGLEIGDIVILTVPPNLRAGKEVEPVFYTGDW